MPPTGETHIAEWSGDFPSLSVRWRSDFKTRQNPHSDNATLSGAGTKS